jgi:uncharacterized protein (DUF302 family)
MSYYFSRKLDRPFDEVVQRTRKALQLAGFGVISEIDVAATLRAKLGLDFRPYLILGACNPTMAHEALKIEDKVGTMLPCNVVIQADPSGRSVEVAAIDPVASMRAINNPALAEVAHVVGKKLKDVVETL